MTVPDPVGGPCSGVGPGRIAAGRHVLPTGVSGRGYRRVMSTRTHICVFFDDGELEHHVCACGRRALYLLDEDGSDGVLVPEPEVDALDDTAVAYVPTRLTGPATELAVSA